MKKRLFAVMLLFAMLAISLTGCIWDDRIVEYEHDSFEDSVSSIPSFKATDLEGNPVDESIFKNADITVVNCWGTFCTPCIAEMPELADWAKEMPENVQMVGMLCDYMNDGLRKKTLKTAVEICDKAGVEYVQIVPDKNLQEILNGVFVYPTTFFVDRSGNVVGKVIEGADVEAYKNEVNTYLEGLSNEAQSNS